MMMGDRGNEDQLPPRYRRSKYDELSRVQKLSHLSRVKSINSIHSIALTDLLAAGEFDEPKGAISQSISAAKASKCYQTSSTAGVGSLSASKSQLRLVDIPSCVRTYYETTTIHK